MPDGSRVTGGNAPQRIYDRNNNYLEIQTVTLRKLMGEANDESGEAFNQLVAEQLAKNEKVIVDKKVKRFGDCKLPLELGDFDVLVIDSRRKRLIPIECKDLSIARTAHDMANEIRSLFHGHGHKKSYVEKHQRRVLWLKENIDDVLRGFGIDSAKRWKIEPLIVVSRELMTPYLQTSPIPVISYEQLMKEKENGVRTCQSSVASARYNARRATFKLFIRTSHSNPLVIRSR